MFLKACISPNGDWYDVWCGKSRHGINANGGDQGSDFAWSGEKTHRYLVTEVGSDYKLEKIIVTNAPYYAGFVDQTTDEFIYDRHGFETGDAVRYAKGSNKYKFQCRNKCNY